jgi:hypothetical protein
MSEVLDFARPGGGPPSRPSPDHTPPPIAAFFDRRELNEILSVYSRMVSAGEWCDYAIELDGGGAAFAVYRRDRARPAYRIVKAPKPALPGRRYRVTAGGRILDCGRVLGNVLRVFDRAHLRLVEAD